MFISLVKKMEFSIKKSEARSRAKGEEVKGGEEACVGED